MKTMPFPTLFRCSTLAAALALASPVIAHPAPPHAPPGQAQNPRDEDRDARAAHARDRRDPQHPATQRPQDARSDAQARQAQREMAEHAQANRRDQQERARQQARQQQQTHLWQAEAREREQARAQQEARAGAQQLRVAEHQREAAEERREDMQRRAAAERRADLRRAADRREDAQREAARRRDAELAQQRERQRVSDAEHRQRIADQQRRLAEYRALVARHEALERAQYRSLQQARRMQAWRYQQAYWAGQRALQARWATRGSAYDSDPYYWAPANYRYQRDGRSYLINQYAADLLRQAVRLGYDQGARAAEADRLDRWNGGYRNNYAWQDALYGYNGYYVSPDEYSYYFRQGFQRGYQDAYNRGWQYGRYDNGRYDLLSSVLQLILNLQPLG